ncbi:HigA family addiction module antitoxin [Treponema primitia]|uniref:HigA family addiction module antitoxin n=1 Tax=Treponema primitia TaxID=88058 RepID=UPI0002555366|nr:HigA family addiction module antitoxin [Treponema primitia]
MKQIRKPVHPGKVFLEDVLVPLNLTITDAADLLGVTRKTLSEFVNEKSALSPVMAIRIAKATHTTAESWLTMQIKRTLWEAEQYELSGIKDFPPMGVSA